MQSKKRYAFFLIHTLQEEVCTIKDKLANEIQFGEKNRKRSLLMSLDGPSNFCDDGKCFKIDLEKFLVGPASHWWYQSPADWLWPLRSCYPFLYVLNNCYW